jgi:hypothetical protein
MEKRKTINEVKNKKKLIKLEEEELKKIAKN